MDAEACLWRALLAPDWTTLGMLREAVRCCLEAANTGAGGKHAVVFYRQEVLRLVRKIASERWEDEWSRDAVVRVLCRKVLTQAELNAEMLGVARNGF